MTPSNEQIEAAAKRMWEVSDNSCDRTFEEAKAHFNAPYDPRNPDKSAFKRVMEMANAALSRPDDVEPVAWMYEREGPVTGMWLEAVSITPPDRESNCIRKIRPLHDHNKDIEAAAYEKAAKAARDAMLENYHSHFEDGGDPHDGDAQIDCVMKAIRALAEEEG